MKMDLSHKDLVKLGVHESKQGHSLNEIEADFSKKGISRKETIKALKEVEYHNKRDEALKAKETASKKLQDKTAGDAKSNTENAQSAEKKSSFWVYLLVFLVLAALAIFYYSYNNKF
ncbi:hypothetical protein HYW20_05060 [Candidatus Woesearchaeota archaeon]|nr:hypothetical protein [Candidatus Woesearchaeota archaeon]